MRKIFNKRIVENRNLFKREELEIIQTNFDLMKKIYILGLADGKEIYEKN